MKKKSSSSLEAELQGDKYNPTQYSNCSVLCYHCCLGVHDEGNVVVLSCNGCDETLIHIFTNYSPFLKSEECSTLIFFTVEYPLEMLILTNLG